MNEEKSSEENTESQNESEIHKENSVDSKEDVEETNAESQSDSEDKEKIQDSGENKPVSQVNENNPEQQGEVKMDAPVDEQIEKPVKEKPLDKKGKEGSFMPIFFVMIISLVIAFSWEKIPIIQNSVHSVLDPTAGALLNWDLTIGMVLIVLMITLITTIIQKYATDQEALRELKKQQKILQEEMKKYKDHPEKVAELSKKQLQFIPKTFKLTSRAIMFTGIPFILFFRWFNDVFTLMEVTIGEPVRFFGFFSWFWFYLVFAMVFSSVLRKMFKVV